MIRRTMIGMAILPAVLLLWTSRAEPAPLRSFTVEQFNELYRKWVGRDVRVSGRVSQFGQYQVRLLKCEIPFNSRRRMKKSSKLVTNMQIDGRVVRKGRKYAVQIIAVRELKTDIQEFQARKSKLDQNSSAPWYELAEWAGQVGRYYEDKELTAASREAYEQGIAIERKSAQGRNPSALKKLAVKVENLKFSPTLRESLLHEAYVLMRDRAKSSEDYQRAISGVSRDLPGCEIPLTKPYADLREKYKDDPLAAYEQVGGGRRKILNRMLMTDLVLAGLLSELDKDFLNGFEIANKIEQEIPEFRKLAQEYRNKALAARTREVATLSRREALDLKADYESQQQPKKGEEVFEAWLEQRLRRLEENDVAGLISLADDYSTQLDRPDRGARLLMRAYRRNPKDREIAARLERFGYRLHNGKWLSELDAEEDEESEFKRAMREGKVLKRMTSLQVRKSQGVPIKIIRIASNGKISEVWIYEQLVVRLVRFAESPESRVVEFGRSRTPQ